LNSMDLEENVVEDELVLRFNDLEFPHDFQRSFTELRPLALDIGAGKGEFVLKMAQAKPEFNYLSIEVRAHRVRSIVKKLRKAGLENVRVLHARIEHAIPHSFFRNCVKQIYMNFPDPWQKNKQKNKRTVSNEYLDSLASMLEPGGKFYFATDVPAYAQHTFDLLDGHSAFGNELSDKPWLEEVDEIYHTLFYHHALKEGRGSHFLRFYKPV